MARRKRTRRYRHRITIEANDPTFVSGDKTDDWDAITDGEDVPCDVRYETTNERVRAGRNEGNQSIVVELRNHFTITPSHRIEWDSAYWEVNGFPWHPDLRHRFMRFAAVKTDSGNSP